MSNIKKSFLAGLFSIITIGILTGLTYKTELGIFLLASFGSSMVLLYGYPESPFAQPKNVFFGHFTTTLVGLLFLYLFPIPIFLIIPLAVGVGVGLMIFVPSYQYEFIYEHIKDAFLLGHVIRRSV